MIFAEIAEISHNQLWFLPSKQLIRTTQYF